MNWFFLTIVITCDVIATTALKASDGFTRWGYGGCAIIMYCIAFYFLALVLRTIPVAIAYTIWCGTGIAVVTIIGAVVFNEKLDYYAILGISLIAAGVIILQQFSQTNSS